MTETGPSPRPARRPFKGRLALRLALGLCLGAAAILYAADQLSLHRQRQQLEGLVALSADRTAGIIHRAAHDGMLRNDADGVRRIIENIAAQEGVDSVRIYNKEGRVRVSSREAEEGALVSRRVSEAMGRLDPRERHIVEARIMGEGKETLRDLGQHFGFSRERARQLEIRALEKLRRELQPLADEVGWPISAPADTDL